MSKHTPGPWAIKRTPNRITDFGQTHPAVNGWRVSCQRYEMAPEEHEANARLIAAAPELLALLQDIEACLDIGDPVDRASHLSQIRAAIAKAEGTPSDQRCGTCQDTDHAFCPLESHACPCCADTRARMDEE
jgi:hypothetical protein